MRKPVKYRLLFLLIAIVCYTFGFIFIPETITPVLEFYPVIIASLVYFTLLPSLYWFMIIKVGKQKAWKLIIIFSLSSAIARYSFPEEIAQHFDFILWLRYPIIAILLIIELYLMFIIVKGLWKARNLSGDPRISVLGKYPDEKKQGLALTLATEPASWYYAIPRLSRNHVKPLNNISLWSGNRWHYMSILIALFSTAIISYWLLAAWSETVAIIAATFIVYGLILMTANYRLSRHYSVYIKDEKLIINNSIMNFMVVPLIEIESVSIVEKENLQSEVNNAQDCNKVQTSVQQHLIIGRSQQQCIKITFKQPIQYWGFMGAFVESFEQVLINVEQPNKLINALEQINSPQSELA